MLQQKEEAEDEEEALRTFRETLCHMQLPIEIEIGWDRVQTETLQNLQMVFDLIYAQRNISVFLMYSKC